jgi:hypothetical protein
LDVKREVLDHAIEGLLGAFYLPVQILDLFAEFLQPVFLLIELAGVTLEEGFFLHAALERLNVGSSEEFMGRFRLGQLTK